MMFEAKGTQVQLTNDELKRLFTWLQMTSQEGEWPDYITLIQGPSNGIGSTMHACTHAIGEKSGHWVQLHDEGEW